MNIIYLILLNTLFQTILASSSNMNYNNKLKKIGFKVIIFREKKYPKMLNYIKQQYKIYYDKSMIAISNGINEYENLPYEEKAVVDFIMSIIF